MSVVFLVSNGRFRAGRITELFKAIIMDDLKGLENVNTENQVQDDEAHDDQTEHDMTQMHAGHHVVVHEKQICSRSQTVADFGKPLEHLEHREGGAEGQRYPEPSHRLGPVAGPRGLGTERHEQRTGQHSGGDQQSDNTWTCNKCHDQLAWRAQADRPVCIRSKRD